MRHGAGFQRILSSCSRGLTRIVGSVVRTSTSVLRALLPMQLGASCKIVLFTRVSLTRFARLNVAVALPQPLPKWKTFEA